MDPSHWIRATESHHFEIPPMVTITVHEFFLSNFNLFPTRGEDLGGRLWSVGLLDSIDFPRFPGDCSFCQLLVDSGCLGDN